MHLHILGPTTVAIDLGTQLGSAQATQFREQVRTALSRAPRDLLFECASLTYIDSTGLGLLSLAQSEAARIGCVVKLANVVNTHVRQVLGLMQFDKLFPMISADIGGRHSNFQVVSSTKL